MRKDKNVMHAGVIKGDIPLIALKNGMLNIPEGLLTPQIRVRDTSLDPNLAG